MLSVNSKGGRVKYKVIIKDKVIGTTELERSDPPMGFVFGILEPSQSYTLDISTTNCKIFISETDEEVTCEFITLEDHSEEWGEQCIEVTVLVESAEEYEKFFKHHLDAYEKQFI